jgi:Tol biopolymer transport system component
MARMDRAVCVAALLAASMVAACSSPAPEPEPEAPSLVLPGEVHLSNVRQLTTSGQNAEAYFSFDGQWLSFQSTGEHACDQIYTMRIDGSERRLVSTGKGRTTCAHYATDGKSIIYASTHVGGDACPPEPDFATLRAYVWPIYDTYDIFKVDVDGSNFVRLTDTPGYDAEGTIGPDGTIVFTSVRDGDMDIYTMGADGSNVRRLTNMPGPDGGAFFSADGSKIVFRGRHPGPGEELDKYKDFLSKALWEPTSLEIYVMDADGGSLRQVTNLGAASFAPFFTPDGTRIIFSSNHHVAGGREFDLFLINADGTGLEQVTFSPEFDGFPMFSPDGTKVVFASNRNAAVAGETNIFIADWK